MAFKHARCRFRPLKEYGFYYLYHLEYQHNDTKHPNSLRKIFCRFNLFSYLCKTELNNAALLKILLNI